MSVGSGYIRLFMGLAILAVVINFLIIPMFNDIGESTTAIAVNQVGTTNSTGNQTAQYSTNPIGLFGDPAAQLGAMLLILGVAAGIAAIAVFGTGAQPGPAAVVAFLVAIALIIVNVLLAAQPLIESIPFIGLPAFIILVALVFVSTLYVAAGFMASGSAQ